VQQPRRVPGADLLLARAGLLTLLAAAGLAALVVPVGGRAVSDSSIGLVWFNAADVAVWVAFWSIGWGSNSSWGLVGGYRFLAQALAYELPHMFALVAVATAAGSLRLSDVVAAQQGLWFGVWMPVAFAAYLLAVLGLSAWGPFGRPVGADVAGGLGVELAGVDRALLHAGRGALLAVGAAMAVPLFLGGGAGPWLPPALWWLVKTLVVLGVLVGLGRLGPAVRVERFTEQAWLWWVPATLAQALVVAVVVL
jgi:NADH-quinone oxidoreductase subunit H